MITHVTSRTIARCAVLFVLATPSAVFASYTSTISGSTATMVGDGAGDALSITQSGGLFQHNRTVGEGFNSASDFDTTMAGDQTVSSTTGIININAGDGNDTIALGNGINLRGMIDGGGGTDTIDYTSYTTAVSVNLGIGTTDMRATLGSNQEVPPTTHAGTGTATVTNYNASAHTFDISVTVSGLPPGDVIGFHLHQERVGSNGPIIVDFTGVAPLVPSGTGFTFNATGLVLPATGEAAFLGGGTYVNVHTPTFPGGAIRGQLFVHDQHVNLASGTATGTTSIGNVENVTCGSGSDSLVGSSSVNVLNGGPGADWILGGQGNDTLGGDAGADAIVWNSFDGTDVVEGGADGDAVQVNGNNLGANFFLQIFSAGTRISIGDLTGGLDIGTTETLIVNGGVADDSFNVSTLVGSASLTTLNLNGFEGNDTVHYRADWLGAVALNLNGGLGDQDNVVLDAHTRGQIRANLGLSTTGLNASLGGNQEVPPTTHLGTGTATVTNYNIATLAFDISVTVSDLPPGDVTGFHIHQERVGVDGPIIVDFTAGPLTPSGTGFTFSTTGVVLPELSESAFLGGGTYLNIHTAAFPGGAIRGQLFSAGNATLVSGACNCAATLVGFENMSGGPVNDSLVGSAAVNVLSGGAGNDWIVGGPGNDVLSGSSENDVFLWNDGDDTDVMDGGLDNDTVQVNGSTTAGDVFAVSAYGSWVAFARTSPGPVGLDIRATEMLIVNGLGGNDTITVNDLTGVHLTTQSLNGFEGSDTFNVRAFASGTPTSVKGGPPGSDTLNYDARSFPISGDTTTPDGVIHSPGRQSVAFWGMSNVNLINPQPGVVINDITVTEGFLPTATFQVALQYPSVQTVTVNFATADSTATAPGDYSPLSGTLTFVPGDIAETFSVPIPADPVQEPSETYVVNLSGAVNTVILDSQGVGTILDKAPSTFTDTPLVAGVTPIRGIHITELRSRIDALRALHPPLMPYAFTDTITSTTIIKAQHVLELRQALQEVYLQIPQTPPTYATTPTPGGSVVVADIESLRAAVLAIE